jgi:DNA-binding NtrC family response regulator
MKARVLVVDDDNDVLALLRQALTNDGNEVVVAATATAMWAALEVQRPDVIVLDWRLPDGDGLELVPRLKQRYADVEVIVLTAFGTLDAALQAVKAGAFHFVCKPIEMAGFLLLIQRAFEHRQLNTHTESLQQAVSALSGGASPVFRSPAMRNLLRMVGRVAKSDAPVLITGESGTGKEVIADILHSLSDRADGAFVKVNCAALPRELLESELFGAVRGIHPDAPAEREGLLAQLQHGTMLLDEILELPLDTQSRLLRGLQASEMRAGGSRERPAIDCRIIVSTNRSIQDALAEHRLREDLYYRISAITLHLPPLRDRPEDILPLAALFLRRFAAQAGSGVREFTAAASECLQRFAWPGNVRQLENEVQRAVLVAEGELVEVHDLSIRCPGPADSGGPVTGLAAAERTAILGALRQTSGNKTAAARQLGITRQTLYNKLKQFGLEA